MLESHTSKHMMFKANYDDYLTIMRNKRESHTAVQGGGTLNDISTHSIKDRKIE